MSENLEANYQCDNKNKNFEQVNKLLAAMEIASDGIALLKDDCFIYLNQAHGKMFGYSNSQELIGKCWHILYDDRERRRFEAEAFPVLQKRGTWQGTAKAKRCDGSYFDEELTLTFTPEGDLICVCRDITERVKAQKALEKTQVELERQVIKRTEKLALQRDRIKQLHRLSTSKFVNIESLFEEYLKTGCEMFNLSTGVLHKVNNDILKIVAIQSILFLDKRPELLRDNSYCVESLKTLSTISYNQFESIENNSLNLDRRFGSYISTPIFVNDRIYGILSFFHVQPRISKFTYEEREIIELMAKDIGTSLASVKVRQALEESEKRFHNTFEKAAVGMAHVSIEGRFLRVNQRFCNIVGYDRDSLKELTFQEITHPEDLNTDLEYCRQVLAGKISTYSMEKRYFKQDGSMVWINLTVSLVKNNLNEPDYFISVIEDISKRKKTELELEESRDKLTEANLAKDEFISHMSHELRTPLNSIIGFTEILRKTASLKDKEMNSLDIVRRSGEHLLALINDILDVSKISNKGLELEEQNFNFYSFLQNIVSVFKFRSEQKGLVFIEEISPTLPQAINTDGTRLRQVIDNLLSNALKFTDTGNIALKVGYVWEFEETESLNKKIRFQVEDTGIGIPQDKLNDIFNPFEQLSGTNQQGTGLGLTICQQIVQLMGGEMNLISEPSVGSKFWFDLELMEVEMDIVPSQVNPFFPIPSRLSRSRKILVVDDNDFNRNLLVNYLEPLGFTLAEASNGEIGLSLASTFKPDAILVDLVMPVMDGMEMISNLQQRQGLQNTVIIIISANQIPQTNFQDINYAGSLSKPFSLNELLSLLENNLELHWQLETINTNNSSTMVVPPPEKLRQLIELVNYGDIEAIEQQINNLEESSSEYTFFNQEVRQLLNSCQQDRLEKMLNSFLD